MVIVSGCMDVVGCFAHCHIVPTPAQLVDPLAVMALISKQDLLQLRWK